MVKPLNFKLVFDYCLILLPLFFLENIPLVKAIPITPTINNLLLNITTIVFYFP